MCWSHAWADGWLGPQALLPATGSGANHAPSGDGPLYTTSPVDVTRFALPSLSVACRRPF